MKDKYWVYGLGVALIMGGVISLFASPDPDGMERVLIDFFGGEEEFEKRLEGKEVIESPMSDYVIPGLENKTLAASLAGVIGVFAIFILVVGLGMLLKNKK